MLRFDIYQIGILYDRYEQEGGVDEHCEFWWPGSAEWACRDDEAGAGQAIHPQRLRDGIEAALRADSAVLANPKPRTVLELLVRGALNARKGKVTALKLMMEHLDRWTEDDESEDAQGLSNLSSNSLKQGISEGILKKRA